MSLLRRRGIAAVRRESAPEPDAPAIVGTSAIVSAVSSPLTLDVPSGTVEDDLLIAAMLRRASNTSPSTPSGWTDLGEWLAGPENIGGARLKLVYRFAPTTPPATYGFTFGDVYARGFMVSVRDVDTVSPFAVDVVNHLWENVSSGEQAETVPALTTVAGSRGFVISWTQKDGVFDWLGAAGHTVVSETNSGGNWVPFSMESRAEVAANTTVDVSVDRDTTQAAKAFRTVRFSVDPAGS